MNQSTNHRRGYVLLLSLVLLALAAAALAGVARASLQRSLAAARAQEDLQRNWAMLSCRRAVLPQAEAILARAAEGLRGSPPVRTVKQTLELGGQRVELTVSDEQAKVNLNALLARRDAPEVERAVRELLTLSPLAARVRLQPIELDGTDSGAAGGDLPMAPLGSWAQVFVDPRPEELLTAEFSLEQSPADAMTLWPTRAELARLNFRRADLQGLRLVCAPLLDAHQSAELIRQRDLRPSAGLPELLAPLGLSNEALLELERRLTTGSTCHSLWIRYEAPTRTHWQLAVYDGSTGDGAVEAHERVLEW